MGNPWIYRIPDGEVSSTERTILDRGYDLESSRTPQMRDITKEGEDIGFISLKTKAVYIKDVEGSESGKKLKEILSETI